MHGTRAGAPSRPTPPSTRQHTPTKPHTARVPHGSTPPVRCWPGAVSVRAVVPRRCLWCFRPDFATAHRLLCCFSCRLRLCCDGATSAGTPKPGPQHGTTESTRAPTPAHKQHNNSQQRSSEVSFLSLLRRGSSLYSDVVGAHCFRAALASPSRTAHTRRGGVAAILRQNSGSKAMDTAIKRLREIGKGSVNGRHQGPHEHSEGAGTGRRGSLCTARTARSRK